MQIFQWVSLSDSFLMHPLEGANICIFLEWELTVYVVFKLLWTRQLKNELEICCNCEQKTLLQKICVKNF